MKKYSLKSRHIKKSKKRSTKRKIRKTSSKYHKKKDGMVNDDPIQPPPGGVGIINFNNFDWQEVSDDIISSTFRDLVNNSEKDNRIKIIDENNSESVTIDNSFLIGSDNRFNSIYISIVFDEENYYFYINILYDSTLKFQYTLGLIRHFKNGNIHYFKMIPDNNDDITPPGGV